MSILASAILDTVAATLLDGAQRTWSEQEKLDYLNQALQATAGARPADFYVVELAWLLTAGEEQHIPNDGIILIDITRNAIGTQRIVTQVDKDLLAESARFWPAATRVPGVEHYTFDPRNPRRFRVFPPNDGTGQIELVYGAVPPQVNYKQEVIDVSPVYEPPLIQYVLARCWAKNSKRQDITKSAACMQQWGSLLGLKSAANLAATPKVGAQPGTSS
jgi:hypothetical protein